MQDPKQNQSRIDFGNPQISLRSLFERDSAGGVQGWFGDRHIAYSVNARAAIRNVCKLLDLGPGDEILAPAYHCGSEIDPLLKCGAAVSLYSIDRSTNINLKDLEERISPRTKAIYVIHYFGFCQPEIGVIQRLCRERDIYLIEDCALALFSEGKAGQPGAFGDVSVFCFYKYFPVAGGGALVVNNPTLDVNYRFERPPPISIAARTLLRRILGPKRLKFVTTVLKRTLGRSPVPKGTRNGATRLAGIPAHYYFDSALENARMSVFARWPLLSFNVKDTIQKRRANYTIYLRELHGLSSVRPLFPELLDGVCPLSFPMIAVDRDGLCDALKALSISETTWWLGYHKDLDCSEFRDTQFLKNNVLVLPTHQFLNERHVVFIANHVKRFVSTDVAEF